LNGFRFTESPPPAQARNGIQTRGGFVGSPRAVCVPVAKRSAAVPKGAICFGCNQSFEGNPVGLQFETDLLPPHDQAELSGLYFHPGHLYHYARRREWHQLSEYLAKSGPSHF
jgi:hypothetical protein